MVIIYLGMKEQIGQKDIIFSLHTVIKNDMLWVFLIISGSYWLIKCDMPYRLSLLTSSQKL